MFFFLLMITSVLISILFTPARQLPKTKKAQKKAQKGQRLAEEVDGYVGFIDNVDLLEKYVNNKVDSKALPKTTQAVPVEPAKPSKLVK